MGILPSHLHILAMEQEKHPLRGDVLTLGQQAVYSTLERAQKIFALHKLKCAALPQGFSAENKIPSWRGTAYSKYTNAQAVLSLLGARRVYSADVSDYENPDFIIDFNKNVAKEYYDRFDVIFDIGTIEHVFDISTALSNLVKMVKTGGDIILILPCSNAIDHGFYSFSPTLLFDFFSKNGFGNFSCYIREGSSYNYLKKGKLYRYTQAGPEYTLTSNKGVEVCFWATKIKPTAVTINKPIQKIYENNLWVSGKNAEKGCSSHFPVKMLKQAEFLTREFRPEWVDIFFKKKKRMKNLTYLGTF